MKTVSLTLSRLVPMAALATAIIAGCGSDSGEKASAVTSLASISSKQCVSCHSTNQRSVSSTSGVKITEQWLLSAHNTAEGAGCVDCHGYHYQYITPDSCRNCHAKAHGQNGTSCAACHGGGSKDYDNCVSCHQLANLHKNPPVANPDAAGKCLGCHNGGKNFRRYTVASRHFTNFTGSGTHAAMYVTTNYQKSCTACHEPHNPLKGLGNVQRIAWAKSGHGDVNGVAWATEDFKESASCIRCHTATGFINYAESSFTLPRTTWATAGDTSREVLTCRACHLSSNFKNSVRNPGPFTAPYGIVNFVATAPLQYPDVGESNLCIPCHSGRENGTSIKKTVSNFSNASFKNPHYLAAAAVFYGRGGFQFYSSTSQTPYAPQAYTSKYGVVVDGTVIKAAAASTSNSTPAIAVGDILVGDKAPWNHGKLGMNNFQTTKTAAVIAEKGNQVYTGTNGQCVTCHLGSGAKPGLHSFNPFEVARSTWTTSYKGCYGCHTNEDIQEVAEEEEFVLYSRLMDFFKWQLAQVGAYYTDRYPYFFTDATYATAQKNWNGLTIPGGTGAANMGAAMNYKLLAAEKGAHVHNRTFMKELIFDSIQYLQKGTVIFSNRYITTNSQTDPNGLISFTGYSTVRTAQPDKILNPATAPASAGGVAGQPISITQLKAYITRKNTGSSGAIGSSAIPLYTRP